MCRCTWALRRFWIQTPSRRLLVFGNHGSYRRCRVQRNSAFRRRLVRVPFDLHHPLWVEDPNFDVIHHVRRVALPAPGGPEQFGEMIRRIISTPLDRSRALWEAWVIEGLSGNRFGLMLKFHHAAVDGVSGASLLMSLFDQSPEAAPYAPPQMPRPERIPSEMELIGHALRSRMKQPVEFAKVAGKTLFRFTDIVQRQLDPSQPVGGRPLNAPRTAFNASVSARRKFATARLSLSDIKEVKNALDVTVNDVVIAVAGGALRSYLQKKNALPNQSLTAVIPISVRNDDEADQANNKVSAMWTSLGTDIADPIARIKVINKSTRGAKEEQQAMGAETLQSWAELAAPRTFNMAMRFYSRMQLADYHRPVHNLVISNVPGPRFPLYLAGAKLEAIYPMGPVMEGSGLNLTVMSYLDSVDFGFLVDSELVPDVWELAAASDEAFKELRRAARRHEARAAKIQATPEKEETTATKKNSSKSRTSSKSTGAKKTSTRPTARKSRPS
ncbi:MAG: wax ester/triacylglycerol synthase family O-acyltransferase [Polyangiales bacterium]